MDLSSVWKNPKLSGNSRRNSGPSQETTTWQAWGVDGGIRIDGLSDCQTIEVVNILGQTVHRSILSNPNTFIPLKTGIYLVRINNHTVKTIVN